MSTHLRGYDEPVAVKSCWNRPGFFLTLARLISYDGSIAYVRSACRAKARVALKAPGQARTLGPRAKVKAGARIFSRTSFWKEPLCGGQGRGVPTEYVGQTFQSVI